jgi:hypothetical protein
LGAVGELDHAAHVVQTLFHAGHVEADGAAKLASWLRPGGEPIGSVKAKLRADISGGRWRDRILGHLHVLGASNTPGATPLTVAVADLVGSVLLVAVTMTNKLCEPEGAV